MPLFQGGDPLFLSQVGMALRPRAVAAGEIIIKKGDPGGDVPDLPRRSRGARRTPARCIATLRDGDCFGEIALLLSEPRTATVRAKTLCDLFVLDKADFSRILHDHPQFAQAIKQIALERYNKTVEMEQLMPSNEG